MRVLIVTSDFPRHSGDGGPRSALDLALALLRHAEVTVLAPSQPSAPARERWDGLEQSKKNSRVAIAACRAN